MAQKMMYLPVINSGVFALPSESKSWERWQHWFALALEKGRHKMTEQNALNAAIYAGEVTHYPLPAGCNWICGQCLPLLDRAAGRFVEPLVAPYEPISIMHVTPRDVSNTTVATVDGESVSMPLDYLPFREFMAKSSPTR